MEAGQSDFALTMRFSAYCPWVGFREFMNIYELLKNIKVSSRSAIFIVFIYGSLTSNKRRWRTILCHSYREGKVVFLFLLNGMENIKQSKLVT